MLCHSLALRRSSLSCKPLLSYCFFFLEAIQLVLLKNPLTYPMEYLRSIRRLRIKISLQAEAIVPPCWKISHPTCGWLPEGYSRLNPICLKEEAILWKLWVFVWSNFTETAVCVPTASWTVQWGKIQQEPNTSDTCGTSSMGEGSTAQNSIS